MPALTTRPSVRLPFSVISLHLHYIFISVISLPLHYILCNIFEWSLHYILSNIFEWSLHYILGNIFEWLLHYILANIFEWPLRYILANIFEWPMHYILGNIFEWPMHYILGNIFEWLLHYILGNVFEWPMHYILGNIFEWPLYYSFWRTILFEITIICSYAGRPENSFLFLPRTLSAFLLPGMPITDEHLWQVYVPKQLMTICGRKYVAILGSLLCGGQALWFVWRPYQYHTSGRVIVLFPQISSGYKPL